MGRLFAFITQLRNLTSRRVGFRVPNFFHTVRDLPSQRTRIIKQHRIVRFCREYGPEWTIGILIDGEYTGIEIQSSNLLEYARIVFRFVRNEEGQDVLCVEGIEENQTSDYILRLRYFGFMRNMFWDTRPSILIHRADSRVATKLRNIEVPRAQPPPTRQIQGINKHIASPVKEVEKHVRKTSYEEKKNRHHGYSSNGRKSLSPRMSAPSMKPHNAKIYNQIKSPEVMPDSNVISKPMNGMEKAEKPNVNTFIPPDQELRRPRNEEMVIHGIPISPDVQNDTDGFVHGILFVLAFVFVLFVRMSI